MQVGKKRGPRDWNLQGKSPLENLRYLEKLPRVKLGLLR